MAVIPATVYDPRRVFVTFGPVILRGYAPGRAITIRRDATVWKPVDGTNGELKRTRSRKKRGTVDIILRATAPTNRALGILVKIDETSGNVLFPMAVTDTLNGSLHFSAKAYIEGFPEMSYGREEGDISWRFICDEIDMLYPGLSAETLVNRIASPG